MAEEKSDARGFYGWINLAVLSGVGIIGGFYIASLSYFLDSLLTEFGWNNAATSLTSWINMIALGLSGPVAGAFIMKFGARRALALGNSLGFVGFFLLSFHSHLWQLYLGFGVLVGTGAGLGGLLATTTVINNWFVKKRSLALGLALSIGGFGGMAIGPAIMEWILRYGWRNAFMIISALILVFGVIVPSILVRNRPEDLGQLPDGKNPAGRPDSGPKPVPKKTTYRTPVDFTAREALKTPCLWLLIAYYCMSMLAINALMFHQVKYLIDFGIDPRIAAFALSVMTGVMAFSQLGTGFVGMKFSMISIAVCAEILKIAGIVILVSTHSLPLVFTYMVVLGLGFGAYIVAMMNIMPNYFGVSHYPEIMGFIRLFWAFIGGMGAPIAGYIYDKTGSYLPAFKGTIVILALGLVCLIFAKPPVHPSLKASEATGAMDPVAD
jgi:MFS family permease